MPKTRHFLCILMAFVLLAGSQIGQAKDHGAKHVKPAKNKSEKHVGKTREDRLTGKIPVWLPESEKQLWVQGRPPGWRHGRKTGWHGGNLPPGLAKKQGTRSGEFWVGLQETEARIRAMIIRLGSPLVLLDSALTSLYAGAERGVPVPSLARVIELGIAGGLSPEGIESLTRAMACGVERHADFHHVEQVVAGGLQQGYKDERLTLEVYLKLTN